MTYYPRPITTLFSTTRLHFEYGAQSATAELQSIQSFGLLSSASSIVPALPGTKPKKQIQTIATATHYWLLLIALQHIAITPTALDATTAPDYSVFFYELRYQLRPTRILVQVWRPLRFCPHLRLMSRELGRAYQIAVQSKSSPVPALSSCPECD